MSIGYGGYPRSYQSYTSWSFTVGSSSTTWPVATATVAAPPPKKRTPLEWLEDEVERICAMTRPGLEVA